MHPRQLSQRRGAVAPRLVGWLVQACLALIVGAGLYFVYMTTRANLARLGVESGFGFLDKEAGFAIAQTLIHYTETSTIGRAFLVALLNSVLLAVVVIVMASLLGLLVGAGRLSRNWLASRLAMAYVEIFRNVPVLLQIFFWYFVALRQLPSLANSIELPLGIVLNNRGLHLPTWDVTGGWLIVLGIAVGAGACVAVLRLTATRATSIRILASASALLLPLAAAVASPNVHIDIEPLVRGRFEYEGGFTLMPEFIALAVGLSLYNASYIAETIRSGFMSVHSGQREAARALALSESTAFWRIMLPQAMTAVVPPLATQYANIFRATSLAAAIAYPELVSVFVGTVNNLVGQPVEVMVITLATYGLVSLLVAGVLNFYNRRLTRRGAR